MMMKLAKYNNRNISKTNYAELVVLFGIRPIMQKRPNYAQNCAHT